jgi:hypothetical protein
MAEITENNRLSGLKTLIQTCRNKVSAENVCSYLTEYSKNGSQSIPQKLYRVRFVGKED